MTMSVDDQGTTVSWPLGSFLFVFDNVVVSASESRGRGPISGFLISVSILGLTIFLLLVLSIAVSNAKALFFSTHGWSHRVAGALLFTWLLYGTWKTMLQYYFHVGSAAQQHHHQHHHHHQQKQQQWLLYDVILGLLGIATTLTAARDFPHKYVRNAQGQSGSLSIKALVTQNEMLEHSFYQALNLWQALYLHFLSTYKHTTIIHNQRFQQWLPWLALWMVTSPWLVRGYFPVHSFSNNWNVTPVHQRTPQEILLYRIKKGQYMFYKHVLLHGLNVSMALEQLQNNNNSNNNPEASLFVMTTTLSWRMYWLALNTSYVMEFFLQTLVRRRIMSLSWMYGLQRLLMATSSIAAILILFGFEAGMTAGEQQLSSSSSLVVVRPSICLVSLVLNLVHRHHDVFNVLLTAGIFYAIQQYHTT